MKPRLRLLFLPFLLLFATKAHCQREEHRYKYPHLRCIDVELPLTIGKVDYTVHSSRTPGPVKRNIKKILASFYESYAGDKWEETMRIRDSYFNTLRVQ